MSATRLLIDVGNTRLKWALVRDRQMTETGAALHDGEPARAVAALPAATVDAVWMAHVTGDAHEAALCEAVRLRFCVNPQLARSATEWRGLRNAYREPQRLGVDRWLAMVAAWHARRGAACVVDAGTALTADVIAADGAHRGGLIAAGLETQQRAVLGATRFATRAAGAPYRGGLGDDTESCVRQGAMLACLGAIDRARALAGADAACLLTGGDAGTLRAHLAAGWEMRPQLVLEGLRAVSEND
ncbi:type III pantothenate kinase [Solimonas variicoloris]|uniref:type III pantothenate kinase n=1 Tax=Solimonas variicoloris TaxID=254408 RepID=UPI00036F9EBD|nr:type III pantothenate kinase [Solimonas variicoloris]